MSQQTTSSDRFLAGLSQWLLLLSGVVVLAAALLVPAWCEIRELAWQEHCLTLQARQLREQRHHYEQAADALAANDPVMLQRIAYHYMRLKPNDAEMILKAGNQAGHQAGHQLGADVLPIEAIVHEPVAHVGNDLAPLEPINSRLVRVTHGPTRLATAGVAIICLLLGLGYPLRESGQR